MTHLSSKSSQCSLILLMAIHLGCQNGPLAPKLDDPIVTADVFGQIAPTSANIIAYVRSDGGSTVTERGVCFSTTEYPTKRNECIESGSGLGEFTVTLTGLTTGTAYFARAFATNKAGTRYSSHAIFKTTGVTDIDGNVYPSIKIGQQVWMSANLKTSRYRDGSVIQHMPDSESWSGLHTTGAWSNYNNLDDNDNIYGKLYNGYAIIDQRRLCPVGWDVPTRDEWIALFDFLGSDHGDKLRSTHGWNNNANGSNSSGFNGLPGGARYALGSFQNQGDIGHFWTSTRSSNNPSYAELNRFSSNAHTSGENIKHGASVRCIMD